MTLTTMDFDYLKEELCVSPVNYHECLKAMEKYSMPWWRKYRNGDVRILAFLQIDEEVLLIPLAKFLNGVSRVLDRKISADELHSWNEPLIEEFHKKFPAVMAEEINAWDGELRELFYKKYPVAIAKE